MEYEGQELMLGLFLRGFPHIFKESSVTEPKLTGLSRLDGQQVPGDPPVPISPLLGLQVCVLLCSASYRRSGDSNLGPQHFTHGANISVLMPLYVVVCGPETRKRSVYERC